MRAVCMPHQLAGDRAAAGRRGVGLPGPRRDRRLVSGAGTRDPAMTTRPIRYLIVNGDDFGLTDGVNRGILETHRRGVLTSTSLMVNRRAAPAAAAAARELPSLSVGLHLEFDGAGADACASVAQQLHRFELLMGTGPTHVDSHHDAHSDPRVLPHVLACA